MYRKIRCDKESWNFLKTKQNFKTLSSNNEDIHVHGRS